MDAFRKDFSARLKMGAFLLFLISTLGYGNPPPAMQAPGTPAPISTLQVPPTPIAWWSENFNDGLRTLMPRENTSGAPGLDLEMRPPRKPLRLPVFLISASDSPIDISFEALTAKIQEAFFGPDGAQAFLNAVFNGRGQILDRADFHALKLTGKWADYLTGNVPFKYPTAQMIADIGKALRDDGVSLASGDYIARDVANKRLNRDRMGRALDDLTIDGAIFVLALPQENVYAYRGWLDSSVPSENGRKVVTAGVNNLLKINSFVAMSAFANADSPSSAKPLHEGYLCHELLHLFNIPDLYDRSNATYGCGYWCVMGYGMFGKNLRDTRPVWPSAWVRYRLGVSTSKQAQVRVQARNVQIGLATAKGSELPSMAKILLGSTQVPGLNRLPEHYLLVELRGPARQNEESLWRDPIADRGFIVWEIDEMVGTFDTMGRINPYWPSTFPQPNALASWGQNDDRDEPLVGFLPSSLFQNPSPSTGQRLARNVSAGPMSLFSDDNTFKLTTQRLSHPLGVTLSNWDPVAGTFQVAFSPDLVARLEAERAGSPGPGLAAAETAFIGVASAPAAPALPDTRGETVTLNGRSSEIADQIPGNLRDRLDPILRSYPAEQKIDLIDQGGFAYETPVSRNAKAPKDLKSQIELLSNVFGESVKEVRVGLAGKTKSKASQADAKQLLSEVKNEKAVFAEPFVRLGGELVRVNDVFATLKTTADPDKVATRVTDAVEIPDWLTTMANPFVKSQQELQTFLKDRGFRIPANAKWEKVVENVTGKLVWQCRVPLANGSTVAIEIADDASLDKTTPIKIK